MSPHEPNPAAAAIPLKAHVEELRSRCEAASRFQGGSTYFHEELGIFRAYLDEKGLYLKEPPTELSLPPDEDGNEHQVWYLSAEEAFLKATWPARVFAVAGRAMRPRSADSCRKIYRQAAKVAKEREGDGIADLGSKMDRRLTFRPLPLLSAFQHFSFSAFTHKPHDF